MTTKMFVIQSHATGNHFLEWLLKHFATTMLRVLSCICTSLGTAHICMYSVQAALNRVRARTSLPSWDLHLQPHFFIPSVCSISSACVHLIASCWLHRAGCEEEVHFPLPLQILHLVDLIPLNPPENSFSSCSHFPSCSSHLSHLPHLHLRRPRGFSSISSAELSSRRSDRRGKEVTNTLGSTTPVLQRHANQTKVTSVMSKCDRSLLDHD